MAYLEENAELAYAGNVYVAQGAHGRPAHLVVAEGMSRDLLYVGMTRGREKNTIHVVTGPPDPAGRPAPSGRPTPATPIREAAALLRARGPRPAAMAVSVDPAGTGRAMRQRAPWEAVLAQVMHQDDPERTALEQMQAAQDFVTNTGHLLQLSEAFWWKDVVPQIDEAVRQRISAREYERYLKDPERPAFLQALRTHEIGGRSIEDVARRDHRPDVDGARSHRRGAARAPGKRTAPGAGGDDDLG